MNKKHYLIVGGSQGIGLGLVKRLVAQGGEVTVISRTSDELVKLENVNHLTADVTTDSIAAASIPEVIDGMAYCPGSINLVPFRSLSPGLMLEDFQLNVVAAVKCIQAALPSLKAANASSIVMFSTVAVSQGLPMHASVSAAKGAVEGLSRSLAAELAPKIRVNCIAPGLTATRLAAKFLSSDDKRLAMNKKYPLQRMGEIDDVASVAEFLLTDQSSWMTGQVVHVDGGMSTLRT